MDASLYIGLDVGTQGTKGLLVDAETRTVVARASVAYGLIEGLPPGAAEQHPDTWMNAVGDVVQQLFEGRERDKPRVAGIGVSGQQHGLVVLDGEDRVLRPAKLWCDTSTAQEARELSQLLGRAVPTGFTASKILWLARHEPEVFKYVRSVLLPHDSINLRLTGVRRTEAGDASGTGFFDPVTRCFDMREASIVDRRLPYLLPELTPVGAPCGELDATVADLLGLRAGIPVAAGSGDNMMSAFGSGATREGVVVISLGTSATVFTMSTEPIRDPEGLIAPFCDATGHHLPLVCVMNATGVTEEVRRAFGASHEELTAEGAEIEAGCGGLLWAPYLQGERVPDLPHARGLISGLSAGSLSRGLLYRAAIEGVTFNLAWGVERLKKLGIPVERARLVGGAASNALWRRILCDVLDVPLERLAEPESAALGAALQALWTVQRTRGDDVSADEVAHPFVHLAGDPIQPAARARDVYQECATRFRVLVHANFGGG